jgi:uncharacterized membrane protein YkvA (DUF1232 family)
MPTFMEQWKRCARQLKFEVYALYLAYRDPRTPWYAKVFTALVVGYAFSPIDLIPDFIPVLGYLDDLVLVPLGVVLAMRMIPPQVMAENQVRAREVMAHEKPVNKAAGAVIVILWIGLAVLVGIVVYKEIRR